MGLLAPWSLISLTHGKPEGSELVGTPVDPLFFLDEEAEARSRTCLARSSMGIAGNRPGIQASQLAV